MFNNGLAGSGVYDTSTRFRMYLVVVVGIFAFGSVLYWRSELLVSADYVELPGKKMVQGKSNAKSEHYQIEYLDESLK